MNSASHARSQRERLRAMASAAAVPSATQMSVVHTATTRLFHAARCIWSASASAQYQRSDSPDGGNLSDSDAVSEVSSTIKVGAISSTIASTVSPTKIARSDAAPRSIGRLGARMGLAPPSGAAEDRDDD